MDHVRFETLKREIAAHATVDQLIDLEAQTARLLSERVSEALVARRAVEVAHDHECPHCGGAKIVRHGRDRAGRQRFRCLKTDDSKGCGRTFNALSGTAFARMRKPELWMRYAAELVGASLTKIVDDVGLPINRHTAWRWRHRLLAALEPPKPERLDGIVEVDETFFLRSSRVRQAGQERAGTAIARRTVLRRSATLPTAMSCERIPCR